MVTFDWSDVYVYVIVLLIFRPFISLAIIMQI